MNRIFLSAAVALAALHFATSAVAQPATPAPHVKTIEVTGSAEREVTPDQIWFAISLREYKDGSRKVDIDALERQLVQAVEALRIPRNKLRIDNVSAYQQYWDKKRNTEFLASKRYLIEFSDLNQINPLLERLDARGIESTYIQRFDHSQREQIRRELKIEALKAAKAKAGYLLEAIGEQLGGAREIQELGDGYPGPQPMYRMANTAMAESAAGGAAEIDFKTIQMRMEIRAVFEIR